MKYIIFSIFFLASCTSPQIISSYDKKGNQIHSVLKEPFFGSPNQPSEWTFWYIVICVFGLWIIWKEFKSIKWPKKKLDSSNSQSTESKINNI